MRNRPLQTVLRAILQQLFHKLSQTAVGCRWPEPRAVPCSDPSQGSAAGRSSSSMHCSQRGRLTPDTTSASREVTREPSNHHQINLPPETRSLFILDSDPPNTTTTFHSAPLPNLRGTELAGGLCEGCSSACRRAAETSAPLPRQPGGKLAKRALEAALTDQVGLGQPPRCATALVPQRHCAPIPGCCGCQQQQNCSAGMFKCALYIKDAITWVWCPIVS